MAGRRICMLVSCPAVDPWLALRRLSPGSVRIVDYWVQRGSPVATEVRLNGQSIRDLPGMFRTGASLARGIGPYSAAAKSFQFRE